MASVPDDVYRELVDEFGEEAPLVAAFTTTASLSAHPDAWDHARVSGLARRSRSGWLSTKEDGMSDTIHNDDSLGRLVERVEALERRNAAVEADNTRLARELATLRGAPRAEPGASQPKATDGTGTVHGPLSRRHALKALGGAAVAGAGLAVAGTSLAPDVASAAPISGDSSGPTPGVTGSNTGGGAGVSGFGTPGVDGTSTTSGEAVRGTITGDVGVGASGIGVVGLVTSNVRLETPPPTAASIAVSAQNDGFGTGVKAVSTAGIGVSAQGGLAPLLLVPSTSVVGPPSTGTHAKGEVFVDKNGVQWLCTAAGTFGGSPAPTFVQVITSGVNGVSGSAPGVQVNEAGTGHALIGNVTNASSVAAGVYGVTGGPGQGAKGYNSGTGIGVYGQVSNTANDSPAVYGNTNGKGPGAQGNQTGTGYGVLGNINNIANSVAAVRGVTNGTGPALQGVGGRAQLNLVPGGSLPASGQTGDFFVDSTGGLHYCKGGNSWVALA